MKKILKLCSIVLAIIIMLTTLFVANNLVGNPISKYLANKNVLVYIEETYPYQELIVDDAFYDFKINNAYCINVSSEKLKDLYFNIWIDSFGNVIEDNYDHNITNGNNVLMRLELEYKEETSKALKELEVGTYFGRCEDFFYSTSLLSDVYVSANDLFNLDNTFIIEANKLILDNRYDIDDLGGFHGIVDISVWFNEVDTSFEMGSTALKELKRVFELNDSYFKYVNLNVYSNDDEEFQYTLDLFPIEFIEEDNVIDLMSEYSLNSNQLIK